MYFWQREVEGVTILATPVKIIPTLHGESARRFSVSNDSLRMTDLSNRKQEAFREENDLSEKRLKRYPCILIGRLAVNKAMAHQGIGIALMTFIKRWLGSGGKTGYRFFIVDARNASDALAYYEKNGFTYLIASEEEELRSTRKDKAIHRLLASCTLPFWICNHANWLFDTFWFQISFFT